MEEDPCTVAMEEATVEWAVCMVDNNSKIQMSSRHRTQTHHISLISDVIYSPQLAVLMLHWDSPLVSHQWPVQVLSLSDSKCAYVIASQYRNIPVHFSALKLTKYVIGSIFRIRNITVPLKFLASLLLGWRFISKKERENRQLLEEEWGKSDYSYHRKEKAYNLLKRGRILGLSKMFLKSLIFAVAGMLAFLVFQVAYRRKIA